MSAFQLGQQTHPEDLKIKSTEIDQVTRVMASLTENTTAARLQGYIHRFNKYKYPTDSNRETRRSEEHTSELQSR